MRNLVSLSMCRVFPVMQRMRRESESKLNWALIQGQRFYVFCKVLRGREVLGGLRCGVQNGVFRMNFSVHLSESVVRPRPMPAFSARPANSVSTTAKSVLLFRDRALKWLSGPSSL